MVSLHSSALAARTKRIGCVLAATNARARTSAHAKNILWIAWAERGLVELTPDLRDAWAFPNAGAAARAAGLIRHLIPDLGLHAVAASSLIHRAVDNDIANHTTWSTSSARAD